MKRNQLVGATILFGVFYFQTSLAAISPETQCFTHLVAAAKTNPAFSDLDLTKVQKINGETGEFKSDPFSVATYTDFIDIFNTALPVLNDDLHFFPDKMKEVSKNYKIKQKIHKANRNNSASIIYSNGVKTPIDHWMSDDHSSTALDIRKYFSGKKTAANLDRKYTRQMIDGYYIDSRYVTFGKESDLTLSFPTRAGNPAADAFYPVGRPIPDMREYLIYTHHLSPALGGDFLSCEIFKTTPQEGYRLKDYELSGKGITWDNFGGTRLSETDVSATRVLGNNKFRLGEISYSVTARYPVDPVEPLLRFDGINVSYNNESTFLNPFITLGLFEDSMREAKVQATTFFQARLDFYRRVIASGLDIGKESFSVPVYNDTTEITDGTMCGLRMSQQQKALQLCQGQDPQGNCPTGYLAKQWNDLSSIGAGKWTSCFKDGTESSPVDNNQQGIFCGITMTGKSEDKQLCGGLDPQTECPTGYQRRKWAIMGDSYGNDWWSCFKADNGTASPIISGSMCGFNVADQSPPIRTCAGGDPQTTCPSGYSSKLWANSTLGQWYACFKDE